MSTCREICEAAPSVIRGRACEGMAGSPSSLARATTTLSMSKAESQVSASPQLPPHTTDYSLSLRVEGSMTLSPNSPCSHNF
jgi:hypothetical protein